VNSKAPIPQHVAVVMDGNGRWAKSKGLLRVAGHKVGVESVRCAVRYCLNAGIPYLTIFAFSSENWKRPALEVAALKELFAVSLAKETKTLSEQGVRMRFIGDVASFGRRLAHAAHKAEQFTAENNKLTLVIALNYGGQWDICEAAKKIAEHVRQGKLSVDEITPACFGQFLSTSGMPDPELYIRTSGEYRISNFLLWQLAYTELYFTDTLWPDFDEKAFNLAIQSYGKRERRFGRTSEQLQKPKA